MVGSMDLGFLAKCFFVGVSSACAVGPIFILIFNRSALCGIKAGFASALGASLGDGLFFTLGLAGALSLIAHVKAAIMALNGLGGVFLIGYGMYTMHKSSNLDFDTRECRRWFSDALIRAASLTLINPLSLVFFIVITMQILPDTLAELSLIDSIAATLAVILGSLLIFCLIILIASNVGRSLTPKMISRLSWMVSIVFIAAGAAMLLLFFQNMIGVKIVPYDSIF